ncbi:gram-negative bacteria-binding protein 3-like [Teleopsis dalmanni]|uniref:gram-negative bacteria-binding protein 3-like n=1 Tax=Teleopsis dalmanni TaxID=139649 RepID=UPI0018CD8B0E|nr:gram-negative bacteria-binding protein 3-like [Teleopsis dalmanni]
MNFKQKSISASLITCLIISSCLAVEYKVPKATIKVYHPKGFEVSIPHDRGVKLFAFHGKLNEEMDGLEAGTWSVDIRKKQNGYWTYKNTDAELKIGDTLYYWTFVIRNELGYREDNGEFKVEAYDNYFKTTVKCRGWFFIENCLVMIMIILINNFYIFTSILLSILLLHVCVAYEVPKARIIVFERKGFEVSVPDEEGISLFAFHGKLNEEMEGLEAGTWARDIVKAKNGRWTFTERVTKLHIGDILYYWTYVIYNGLGYREDDGVFVVTGYNITENLTTTTTTTTTVKPTTTTTTTTTKKTTTTTSTNCAPSQTKINGNQFVKCADQLLFEDDFEDSKVDTKKWKLENRFASSPDYEFVMYVNDVPEIFQFENSVMHIKPIATANYYKEENPLKFDLNFGARCTGLQNTDECKKNAKHSPLTFIPPFLSAQLSTRNTLSFKYGRVEIRAKLPQTEWVVPELWLQPVTYAYGVTNYQSGQIRIAFSRTNGTSTDLYGGVILNSEERWRYKKLCHLAKATDKNWWDDYHVFTLIWTEMYLAFAVDNEEYCRIHTLRDINTLPNHAQLSTGTKLAPFDQEFILTLGYGVGGHGDFSDNEKWITPKPWENTDPRAIPNFVDYLNHKHGDWLENGRLSIDSVKVFSV